MLKQHDQVSVCQSYVVALEYSDFSGLSDEDAGLVYTFIDSIPRSVQLTKLNSVVMLLAD